MASREVKINELGDTIKIEVKEIDGLHTIIVDGVKWVEMDNMMHAAVIYNMLADHITEYMNFEKI